MAQASRDQNRIPTLLAVSSVDGVTPVTVYADPVTHRLLIDSASGGSGTVTSVSVVSANGFAGTVATETTTPAITLSTTVNAPVLAGNGTAIAAATTTGSGSTVVLNTAPTFATSITTPAVLATANDSGALGAAGTAFSDLFLAEGGVINWDSGDATLTQSGNSMTFGGISTFSVGTGTAVTLGSIELGATSDTTIARVSAGVVSIEGVNVVTVSATQTLTNKTLTTPIIAQISNTGTLTLPTSTDTLVGRDTTDTLTNKTLTAPTINAGTLSGIFTLAESTSIDLDPAQSDQTWTGITRTGTAGAALAFGQLCYLAVADSRWELADADALATAGNVILGMCVLAAAGDGSATRMLLQGNIRADSQFPALTVGAVAYAGETPGAIQTAIPTGADNIIRVVGWALTADELYFNPSMEWQVTVA